MRPREDRARTSFLCCVELASVRCERAGLAEAVEDGVRRRAVDVASLQGDPAETGPVSASESLPLLPVFSIDCRDQDYEVDPSTHDVSAVENAVAWQEVAPAEDLSALLDACFFPKWLRVLHHWLTHSPNLEEVSNWYLSWKGVFPEAILDAPKVANHLSRALDCMNRAAEGLPIPSPEMLVREDEADLKRQSRTAGASPKRAKERFTLRDMVQSFAEEKNVSFAPKPNRMHDGLQVYGFGGVSVVLDQAQNSIRGQFGQVWKPLSLEQLFLEAQRRTR